MVSDLFDSLLEELGQAMEINDLKLDQSNTCLIKFPSGLKVYIEPYEKDEAMLICTDMGDITPGRYREDVFREALKHNGMPYPRHGTFAFSDQSNHLLFFGLLPIHELNGEKIASFLYPFIERAEVWKQNIDSGTVPLADSRTMSQTTSTPMGMFGLRP